MLRPVAEGAREFAEPVWVLRDKDCLIPLADALGLSYVRYTRASRGLAGNAVELLQGAWRAWRLTRRQRIDLWVTKYGGANIGAWLCGRPSVSFNDDDADVVPLIAWTSYPFARRVLVTDVTRMGRFACRAQRYAGFHELFYLHPNRFTPDPAIRQELGLAAGAPYAIVRLSSLQAHHDVGERGMSAAIVRGIVELAAAHDPPIRVFISSERPIAAEFEAQRFPIAPSRMHDALGCATFYVGDSQTMTAEAAVLGTPALRLSSFVNRLSYLGELERYKLAFGYRPEQAEELLLHLRDLLALPNVEQIFQQRRRRMLAEKVDPVPVFVQALRDVLAGRALERAEGGA